MTQKVADFIAQVEGFDSLPPREKIKIFAWHLHVHMGLECFGNAEIRQCFRDIHTEPPDVAVYLPRMVQHRDLLKFRQGYRLEGSIRRGLDAKYVPNSTVVAVSKLLSDLPAQVPDLLERAFLSEALKCYRAGAYRASIVMAWNLAFDHLVTWILKDAVRVSLFNASVPVRFPKSKLHIVNRESFEDAKEADIIEIAYTASLVTKNIFEILRENLKRRNRAAHPSQVVIVQSQADDAITNLVNNVVRAIGFVFPFPLLPTPLAASPNRPRDALTAPGYKARKGLHNPDTS